MKNKHLIGIIILFCILGAILIELNIAVLGISFLSLGIYGIVMFPFLTEILK